MIQISPSAKEIDIKKLKLEVKYNPKIKKYLDVIADVASTLYAIRGSVDAEEVSENAKPELIALLRAIYRDTIKTFDSSSRDFMKSKKSGLEISKEDNDKVNQQLLESSLFYINNHSETQANEISKTNAKKIDSAVAFGILMINSKIDKISNAKLKAQDQLLKINTELTRTGKLTQTLRIKKKILEFKIRRANKQLEKINRNVNLAVSKEMNKKLKELNVARSEVITEQEVGSTESATRQEEASALSTTQAIFAGLLLSSVKKRWSSILDSRTRETHVIVDGIVLKLNELFKVGSSLLRFPRDWLGSIEEIIRCRCTLIYILT